MENPQNTPSEQDTRNTNDNPRVGRSAADMGAGAGQPPDERMGGTPMEDEEFDVLIESPLDATGVDEATGMPLEGDTSYARGTAGMDTESTYEAPAVPGGTRPTPSQTGVVGSDSGSPEESESGLEGTDTGTGESSSTGVVGAGETDEGGITSSPER